METIKQLFVDILSGNMHDLTPEEAEQIYKNIEKRSKVLPGNYFDGLISPTQYFFVVRNTEEDKVYTVYLQKSCKDYWEALREGQYWCGERPNYSLVKVGCEPCK